MKVNISYAVELEDVPIEAGKLITNVGYQITTVLDQIENLATSNPTQTIEEISEIRECLKDLDLRLADCSNILSGFVDLRTKGAPSPPPLDVDEVEDGTSV